MHKTLLVAGPAHAGKTTLIHALMAEHPRRAWHVVRLDPTDEPTAAQPVRRTGPNGAGLWDLRYNGSTVLTALPALLERIGAEPGGNRAVVAIEAGCDPVLRHAHPYDLRAFVLPPIEDPAEVFRTPDESREELHQIMRDSTTFSAQAGGLEPDSEDSPAIGLDVGTARAGTVQLDQAGVEEFLACPLGAELAARVHLQPAYGGLADADIVLLNTAAGPSFRESDMSWQRLLHLLAKLRRPGRPPRLVYACDLTEPRDPCLQRVLRHMAQTLRTV